jgi:hypothetical protein
MVGANLSRNVEDIFLSNAACLNVMGLQPHSHEFSSSACQTFPRGIHHMPTGMTLFGDIPLLHESVEGNRNGWIIRFRCVWPTVQILCGECCGQQKQP